MKYALLLTVLAMTLGASVASAATSSAPADGKFSVGGLLGPSFLSDDVGTEILFGLEGDYRFMPNSSAGVFVTFNGADVGTANASITTLGGEAKYHFSDSVPGLNIGGKLGLGFFATEGANTETNFVLGPSLGYDYPLVQNVTIGAEGNMMFYTNAGSLTAVNLLGAIRFHF